MNTTDTTDTTDTNFRLPRHWFRTVLREYHTKPGEVWICLSSNTFEFAWNDPTTNRYLRKLAQRFCEEHKLDFCVGSVLLFSTPVSRDRLRAVRIAFLRWCIASTAN